VACNRVAVLPRFDYLAQLAQLALEVRDAGVPLAQRLLQLGDALGSGRFIFLDEFGTNLGLTRRDGRARRGQRVAGRAPVNVGPNVTLTMGLSREGAVAPLVFDGGTDGARFKACLREQLAPHSAGAMWWWPTGWAPTGVAPRGRRSKRAVRASGCCRRTRRT
jgi:hypothetical protein